MAFAKWIPAAAVAPEQSKEALVCAMLTLVPSTLSQRWLEAGAPRQGPEQ